MRRVCFYHAGCPDGFGAVWAVRRAWGDDADYVARGHEDAIRAEDYEGALVVFVDIAAPNADLRALGESAARLVVLDHHVSTREQVLSEPSLETDLRRSGHLLHFDLSHSGAMLAWEHFHDGAPPPDLLRYVEDQDLWAWKLPGSDAVNAAIGSYPRTFEVWDALALRPAHELAAEGEPIVRAHRVEVERLLRTAHPVALGTKRVEAVNSALLRSAIGHELARRAAFGAPWGLVYRLHAERVDVSLYSIGELDVSRIARRHGGGGHRNAAGFSVSLREWTQRFV